MSLLLKVVAEGIDPVMASFELGLCDMAEKGISGAEALINRLCCTTRLMPFVQSIFPHPQLTLPLPAPKPKKYFCHPRVEMCAIWI